MAQRLSEQVVEWLTVGGDAFTPQTSVPLVVSQPGETLTVPTTNGTALGAYINQAQLWILGAAAASTNVKSSQLIVSSSDASSGGAVALELWRGTAASFQFINDSGTFYIKNNYSSSAATTYANSNLAIRYGAVADQYVHIYSTKDSSYAYSVGGAALSVAGGAAINGKVYIASSQASTSNVTGALTLAGGMGIKGTIAPTDATYYLGLVGYKWKGIWLKEQSSANSEGIQWSNATSGDPTARIGANTSGNIGIYGTDKVYLRPSMSSTTVGVLIESAQVTPASNDSIDFGLTATRWKNGYFTTSLNVGAASTSQSSTNAKATYIVPGGVNTNTNNTSSSGYFIYGHGKEYGHLYISQFGTANIPATTEGGTGTAGTAGHMELVLGNSTAVNENTAYGSSVSGADNACGYLTMYSSSTKYMQIRTANISGQHILYLPRINTGTSTYYGKLISMPSRTSSGVDNFSAVGSGIIPIYVTADGVATASTSTVGSGVKPIYLSSGTLTVSSSTVGSGVKPVYLSSGTITASSSTVGSGVKPIYLSSGEITVSSSTVGSGVKPIYLSSGTLTVSSSSLGGTAKPVYMDSGELKAISATVGTATKPVYLSSGTITVGTYELKATVNYEVNAKINAGTATRFAYYSGANAISSYSRIGTIGSARYPLDFTLHNDAGTKVAEFWYDQGTTTNVTSGSWRFRGWSPKSTADTGVTSYYENYFLPTVTTGRTSNADYNILTTKDLSFSITGSAQKVGIAGIWLYPSNNNEINFGGTNTSDTIYFGYRATDSRPKPATFVFGSGSGTATIKAAVLVTSNHGTGNPGSSTAGNGVTGALYFKRI